MIVIFWGMIKEMLDFITSDSQSLREHSNYSFAAIMS
jgi:hypothetical protein